MKLFVLVLISLLPRYEDRDETAGLGVSSVPPRQGAQFESARFGVDFGASTVGGPRWQTLVSALISLLPR